MSFVRALLLFVVVVSVGSAEQIRLLGSKTVNGEVVSIKNDELTYREPGGKVEKVSIKQVLGITYAPTRPLGPSKEYVFLRLSDGTELACSSIRFKVDSLDATTLGGAKFSVPLTSLVGMLRGANEKKVRLQFEKIYGNKVKTDRVFVYSKKTGILNPLQGVLGTIDAEKQRIEFQTGGQVISANLTKLKGLVFYRKAAIIDPPICMAYDNVGNVFAIKTLELEDRKCTLETSSGVKGTLDVASLTRLDYNSGKLVYLSDIPPVDVIEKSGIGLLIRYQQDTNLEGQPIVLDKQYGKGLSMHAHTELEYDLGRKFKNFIAVLGVDNRSGSIPSKATVTILCDNVQVFQKQVNPKKAIPFALDVNNVGRLRIIVSSKNLFDLHDHATLADVRVTK
ncbi:MAG: NPCBM/NEW2 domain-containing protein [Gemmataceae bacterium]